MKITTTWEIRDNELYLWIESDDGKDRTEQWLPIYDVLVKRLGKEVATLAYDELKTKIIEANDYENDMLLNDEDDWLGYDANGYYEDGL